MGKVLRYIVAILCLLSGILVIGGISISDMFQLYDIFYVVLFVICLEVCLLMSLYIGSKGTEKEHCEGIIGKAYSLRNIWLKTTIIWMLVAYWMISSSMLSTLIVIYISSENNKGVDTNRIIFYSIASLFVSVMYYVLSPMAVSRGYRRAFREINKAILKSECQSVGKEIALADAIVMGEEYIERYSFDIKS